MVAPQRFLGCGEVFEVFVSYLFARYLDLLPTGKAKESRLCFFVSRVIYGGDPSIEKISVALSSAAAETCQRPKGTHRFPFHRKRVPCN